MKKQTIKAWAIVSPTTGRVRFDVGYPMALCVFSSWRLAKEQADTWTPSFTVHRVEVTITKIKPKRARKNPSEWTASMGKPVYALPNTKWRRFAEPKPKRARGKK